MTTLFDPIQIGAFSLPNRILMSPLTRCRSETPEGLATPMMAEYYVQRAGAGLILSEGIPITPIGVGYAGVTGLWNDAQAASWRIVTDAVHAAGGRIVAQLWHVGRLSDPSINGGQQPIAPSAVAAQGTATRIRPKKPWDTPRAMDRSDIDDNIDAFRAAARRAKAAGFDGVELHGANGYLIDQFLQDGSNLRTDDYGGSISNRIRFLAELIDAVSQEWPSDHIGVHLSPRDGFSMSDSDPEALFVAVAKMLSDRQIAFVYLREEQSDQAIGPLMKPHFDGALVMNSRLTPQLARDVIQQGRADAVGFGRLFIANPDLPVRLRHSLPLAEPDPMTFYDGGATGYIDYPTWAESPQPVD